MQAAEGAPQIHSKSQRPFVLVHLKRFRYQICVKLLGKLAGEERTSARRPSTCNKLHQITVASVC